jgi:hypothetical protein
MRKGSRSSSRSQKISKAKGSRSRSRSQKISKAKGSRTRSYSRNQIMSQPVGISKRRSQSIRTPKRISPKSKTIVAAANAAVAAFAGTKKKHKLGNASQTQIETDITHQGKIFALSDIHGDLHAFIIVLRDCARVIKKKNIYDNKVIDPEIEKNLIIDIRKTDERFDETFGYEWCGGNSYVVICGDIIDSKRMDQCRQSDRTTDCLDYPQLEIKLLRFINAINKQAQQQSGRIFKLLGNHEWHNIKPWKNLVGLDVFDPYRFNNDLPYYGGCTRRNVFNYNKIGYKLLLEDNCYSLLKINNTIFAHGQLPKNITFEKIKIINNNINTTNLLSGSESIYDWLEDRDYADTDNITTRKYYGQQDSFCTNTVIGQLRFFMNKVDVSKLRVVIGHCVQSSYKSGCTITDSNDNEFEGICVNTTFKSILDDTNETIIIYDNRDIHDGPSDPNNRNTIYGITMQCPKDAQQPAAAAAGIQSSDFYVYHVDIGSSRAFDNSNYTHINTIQEENKELFSRTPQVLLIDNTFNKDVDVIHIIKSKIRNTRIHLPRPIYEDNRRVPQHPLSLSNVNYKKKYLKYKHKYLSLKQKLKNTTI